MLLTQGLAGHLYMHTVSRLRPCQAIKTTALELMRSVWGGPLLRGQLCCAVMSHSGSHLLKYVPHSGSVGEVRTGCRV